MPLATQPAAPAPRRHALLIGVTKYPNLPERYQLDGPLHDVALIRETLAGRFDVNPDRIIELSEAPRANARPTRANIEAAFAKLAKTVGRSDQVMVLFAGHGSQQPDNDPPGQDEADGLDEIFLPSDAGEWDGQAGTARNVVIDDDVRRWITDIRNAGAFVWVVFDSCQSGTMTRGGAEKTRFVPPSLLKIPDAQRTGTRGGTVMESAIVGLTEGAAGIAALYAAKSTETTPEMRLPNSDSDAHGLFTYRLNEVLQQATGAITYRDLVERVIKAYVANSRAGPTPGFEGGGLDQPVLDATDGPGRLRLLIGDREKQANRLKLRAGAIQGLTVGTILSVYPPAGRGDSERLIGYVKVVDIDATDASVEPVAYADTPPPALNALVPDSRCDVALFDYGADVLKVALHPDSDRHGAAATGAALARALAGIEKATNGQAQTVAAATAANWILSAQGDDVVIASTSGWRIDPSRPGPDTEQAPFKVGKANSPVLSDQLSDILGRIARVRGLTKLALGGPAVERDVDLEIDLIRYANKQDSVGSPVPLGPDGRVLHAGDDVAFRLRNTGKTEADVTLLFVDSQYGIDAVFPRPDAESDSRLAHGAEVVTPRFTVNDETVGWEQVVAIAVESSTPRVDFRYLAQPSLELARTRGARTSLLEQLLTTAMFGQGTTRGMKKTDVGKHAIKMLAWRTEAR